ncbi:hypothetical protein HJC23_001789 [Cyclotella cryptica]|uniref:Uncharacterized protein n=1 Tax=Cyclotella cryptica TaxID=29204 RepID=A0ABD3QW49_9STRA
MHHRHHRRHHNARSYQPCRGRQYDYANQQTQRRFCPLSLKTSNGSDKNEAATTDQDERIPNDLGLEIVRGRGDELSDETWRDIEEGAPTKFEVMKSLLGINVFTYILAVFIAFFLSMNAIYGPGWLGQFLGWENVGTFTRVSDSLPMEVDLSGEQYLL